MKKLIIVLMGIIACAATMYAEPLKWVQTNGPTGALITNLLVNSRGDIFALSFFGQLFERSAGSDSWHLLDGQYSSLAIDSKDNLILVRSNGNTQLYDRNMNFIKTIRDVDNEIRNKVFVTNKDAIYIMAPIGGGLFSSDMGENWVTLNNKQSEGSIAGVDSSGIALFSEAGKNFLRRFNSNNNSLDSVFVKNADNITLGVNEIAYNYKYDLFIAIAGDGDIFVSPNKGDSWERTQSEGSITLRCGIYISKDGDAFINDDNNLYRSKDGGYIWSSIEGMDCKGIHTLIEDSGDLVCSKSPGIYRYNIDKKEIIDVNRGLIATKIFKIAIDRDGIIYAFVEYGLYRSSDGGASWKYITFPEKYFPQSIENVFCSKSGTVFVKTREDSWMSNDKGDTWSNLYYKLDSLDEPLRALAEDDWGRIYATGSNLYYSDDNAQTWNKLSIKSEKFTGRNYFYI